MSNPHAQDFELVFGLKNRPTRIKIMGNRLNRGYTVQKEQEVSQYDALIWDKSHHRMFIGLAVSKGGILYLHRAGGAREEVIYITEPLCNTLFIGVYLPNVNRYTRHTVFLLPTSREIIWEYPYINWVSSLPAQDIPVYQDARVLRVEEYDVHRPRFMHPLIDRLLSFLSFTIRPPVHDLH